MAVAEIIEEYLGVIDQIFGLYCDSKLGYSRNVEEFDRRRTVNLQQLPHLSAADLDQLRVLYGHHPEAAPLHQCTQAMFRARNDKAGANVASIGNLCLVQLYQFWEDHFRGEVAKALGKRKNDIVHDVFGDIRLLRNSIIHYRAMAFSDVASCKVLTWFMPGQRITLSKEQFEQLVRHVKGALEDLLCSHKNT